MRRFYVLCGAFWMIVQGGLVFAGDIQGIISKLQKDSISPMNVGSVCEHVAKIEFQELYPEPNFLIEVGIEYYKRPSQTLGELDLVVFDRTTDKAILIAEVKCWGNLHRASIKAQKQRSRFQAYKQFAKNLDFSQRDHQEIHYSPDQFSGEVPFILVSPKGGEQEGFDFALSLTLDELATVTHILSDSHSDLGHRDSDREPNRKRLKRNHSW